jgi:hypothetical protein
MIIEVVKKKEKFNEKQACIHHSLSITFIFMGERK